LHKKFDKKGKEMGLINSNQSWVSFCRCLFRCSHFINKESLPRISFFSPTTQPTNPHLIRNITLKTQALEAPFDKRNFNKLTDIACKVFSIELKVA
jgi:hypothetical protein